MSANSSGHFAMAIMVEFPAVEPSRQRCQVFTTFHITDRADDIPPLQKPEAAYLAVRGTAQTMIAEVVSQNVVTGACRCFSSGRKLTSKPSNIVFHGGRCPGNP